MKKLLTSSASLILLLSVASCSKEHTCPAYTQYPDCKTESRARFYGLYKGISILDNGEQVITQWQVGPGQQIGMLNLAEDFDLNLLEADPRSFTVKDRSFMSNDHYIREEGSKGFFDVNTMTMEFWMDNGKSVESGEQLIHYKFTGTRQ